MAEEQGVPNENALTLPVSSLTDSISYNTNIYIYTIAINYLEM